MGALCRFVRCRKRINADLKVGQVKRYRSPRYLLKALGQPDGRAPVLKGLLKFTCPLDDSTSPDCFINWFAQATR